MEHNMIGEFWYVRYEHFTQLSINELLEGFSYPNCHIRFFEFEFQGLQQTLFLSPEIRIESTKDIKTPKVWMYSLR